MKNFERIPLTTLLSVVAISVAVGWGVHRMHAANDVFLAVQCAKGIPDKKLCGGSYGEASQRSTDR